MNHNYKVFLAVFAVTIMIGSTLVPFAAYNDSGLVTVQTSEDQGNEGSFANLAFALETLKEGLSIEPKVDGTLFVPVDAPSDYVDDSTDVEAGKEISVDSEKHITKTLKLAGSDTYTFTKEGRYIIDDGGKLVLLGLENGWGFTFVNNKSSSEDYIAKNLVILKSGALVCVMGIWFKVITAYESQSFIKCDPGVTLKVNDYTEKTTGKRVISLNVVANDDTSEAVFLNYIHVRNDNKDGSEINIKGTITNEVTTDGKNLLKFGECVLNLRLFVESEGKLSTYITHLVCKLTDISTTVGFKTWDQETDPKVDIGIEELSFKIVSMMLTVNNGTDKLLDVKYQRTKIDEKIMGLDLSVKGMSFTNDAKITESGDSVTSIDCHRTLSFDSMKLAGYGFMTTKIADSYGFKTLIHGVDLGLTKFSVKTESLYSPMEKMESLSSLKFNVSLTADRIRFDGNEFTKVNFVLNNLSLSQDGEKTTFSTGTSVLVSKLVPAGAKSQFDVTVDFSNFASNNDGVIKGNVKAEFVTLLDGANRYLKVSFNGLGILPVTNGEDPILICDKVEYSNDVPMNKVYPTVEGAQSFMGSFVIEDAELGLKANILDLSIQAVVSAKYVNVDFNVLNNGIVDRFGFEINGAFDLSVAYSLVSGVYFEIKSTNDITGYTKVVSGEKKKFVIGADPTDGVDVVIQPTETDKVITIKVVYGNADFSNGGLVPAILDIGYYATFVGNEVSARGFIFECPSESRTGTVMFDLSDGYEMLYRSIVVGDSQISVHRFGDLVDYGGYTIVFDADTFLSGKMRTGEGNLFNSSASFRGLNVTVVDANNANFTLDSLSTDIYVKCAGDKFTITLCDKDGKIWRKPKTKSYNDLIPITAPYIDAEGNKLVGWNDGSRIIKGTIDEKENTLLTLYVMPARNVFMYPVYVEKAEVIDNKVVTDKQVVEIDKDQKDSIGAGFTIITNGAKIVMKDGAVQKIKVELEKTKSVTINVTEIVSQDEKAKRSIVGDNALYGIEMTDGNGETIVYDQKTEFEVTLTVCFFGDIRTFEVSHIDVNGHTIQVPLKSYKKVDSIVYEVTFTVNHFSEYMVQPVYVINEVNMAAVYATVAVLVTAIFFGAIVSYGPKTRP